MFIFNLNVLFFLAAILFQPSAIANDCLAVGVVEQHCGFPAPEDIAIMPNEKDLLFSAFGGIDGEHPQVLRVFNPGTGQAEPIDYLHEESATRWDNGICETPATKTLGSHGIDISQRSDGHWQLLAVNHSRETIEMYEIINLQLAWRGCISFPSSAMLNDVVAIPSGGFLVTHMMDRHPELSLLETMALPNRLGHVWRWRVNKGLDILPGSQSAIPNGIAISPDGQFVFIAETKQHQVKKIHYANGKLIGTVKAPSADNFSWTDEGKLLITGINGSMSEDCILSETPCLAPFQVQSIDPKTLRSQLIWQQDGPPAGAGTVAVKHRGYLYMGSFKGHQVIKVPLSALANAISN